MKKVVLETYDPGIDLNSVFVALILAPPFR